MRPRRVGTGLALAAAALVLGGCDPLDRSELRREVDAIGSAAAEGTFVAEGVAEDRTKMTFVRVHAKELSDSLDESAQKLEDADLQEGIEADARKAISIAGDASDTLGELVVAPGDEKTGREVRKKLEETAAQAEELSASL